MMKTLYTTADHSIYMVTFIGHGATYFHFYATRKDAKRAIRFDHGEPSAIRKINVNRNTFNKTIAESWDK